MTNLTSTLTVKLIDDVSKPARTVAQALEQAGKQAQAIAKAMAGSGATDRFTANLAKLKLSAKDVEQVSRAWKDYSANAKLAASASEWTKAQASDVRRWESQTIRALREVEREQAKFASASKKAMAAGAHPGGEKHGGMWSHDGAFGFTAQAAAAAVSAHSVFEFTKEGVESGAERQHVRVGMLNAGMKPEEIKESEEASTKAARGAPNMSVSEIMELHKEARSAVQHPKEAVELLPMLAKASSVLRGMGVERANIAEVVKAGESLGLMNDVKRFKAFLDGQVKAMAVMGKTIDTTQIYEAAKYSKAAGAALSDRFLNTVMPSLIQEMHGSSAGDALSMLSKTIRGGLQHKHLPVERLNELGMLEDPSKIKRSKTGQIMGYKGKVVGEDDLATDPDKFAHTFNEHMEAHGIHSLQDKVKTLYETLPSTAANLVRILIQQEETLKQHANLYNNAPGVDKAAENQLKDPVAAVGNLTKSFNDLGAAITSPGMANAGAVLSSIAGGIRAVSEAAKDHPATAMTAGGIAAAGGMAGAGYLSYQLLNGFGLRTSATILTTAGLELSGAAKALMAAAGKEALSNGVPGLPGEGKPRKTSLLGKVGKALATAAVVGTTIDVANAITDHLNENPDALGPADRWFHRNVPQLPAPAAKAADDDLGLPGLDGGGDTGSGGDLSGVKTKAEDAKASLDQLNGIAIAPQVDVSALANADAVAKQLLATLQAIGAAAGGAASAVRGINVPSLGKTQRGNFSFGGVKGE